MYVSTRYRWFSWRLALWGGAALLLLTPAIAMQFTDEVNWGPGDFLVFAAMLVFACGAFEAAVRLTADVRRRWFAGAIILTLFLLVWAELAVGIFL